MLMLIQAYLRLSSKMIYSPCDLPHNNSPCLSDDLFLGGKYKQQIGYFGIVNNAFVELGMAVPNRFANDLFGK